ncbi:hypothetical protein AGMMS49949_04590 [Alphaproteobacteria bacterium]|nr:hypothetical protein AGMMS49949_04590 [Alphaproteobacteria bacterium]GHT00530.1 hypothetical protein AGMMS50296_8870 [Alphaproteobacteria bacterium]
MATVEPRVNISLDRSTLGIIREIAKNTKQSISKICTDLIKKQIEDDEDAYYIRLIRTMGDREDQPKISAAEMERRLDALQD